MFFSLKYRSIKRYHKQMIRPHSFIFIIIYIIIIFILFLFIYLFYNYYIFTLIIKKYAILENVSSPFLR